MSVEYAETLLRLEAVSLSLGGRLILREISGEIRNIKGHGQIHGLLGPSGIGKTQLLRIIAGLQAPSGGCVLVGAEQRPTQRGLVGVVQQAYPLFEHRTVYGNLEIAATLAGQPGRTRRYAVVEMLRRFGLLDRWRAYPAQLSGGQRQRVAIAQQLLCSEHFLILDEPFSGLDPAMKHEACQLISEVSHQHELNTSIVITHDIASAVSICDHLWIMGRERTPAGELVPGARLLETYDLVQRGLCWHPDITLRPEFSDLVREISGRFQTL